MRCWNGSKTLLGFLAAHFEVRVAREAFDRALTALPPTQHAVVWERYLAFAGEVECPEMMLDVHDRLSAIDKLSGGVCWGGGGWGGSLVRCCYLGKREMVPRKMCFFLVLIG